MPLRASATAAVPADLRLACRRTVSDCSMCHSGGGRVVSIFRNYGKKLFEKYLFAMNFEEQMAKFYQSRKSERKVIAVVQGRQVPLYGGIAALDVAKGCVDDISVPLNLSFVTRSRAYILGRLVKPKFNRKVMCEVSLRGKHKNQV